MGEVEQFKRADAEQRANVDLTTSSDTTGKSAGKVLVVEDNEFNIEVVRCMLVRYHAPSSRGAPVSRVALTRGRLRHAV